MRDQSLFWVYLGVKTCEVFLSSVVIVRVGLKLQNRKPLGSFIPLAQLLTYLFLVTVVFCYFPCKCVLFRVNKALLLLLLLLLLLFSIMVMSLFYITGECYRFLISCLTLTLRISPMFISLN